jgi:hypothetical protein
LAFTRQSGTGGALPCSERNGDRNEQAEQELLIREHRGIRLRRAEGVAPLEGLRQCPILACAGWDCPRQCLWHCRGLRHALAVGAGVFLSWQCDSVSRLNGHLRLRSLISASTLRRLESTSPRRLARSVVASRVLAVMACASISSLSTFCRLPRASASMLLSCCTVVRASATSPVSPPVPPGPLPWPNTCLSALATSESSRLTSPSVREHGVGVA